MLLRYQQASKSSNISLWTPSFATKRAKQTTRGNTCMQLFVTTDKGFVYVVPLLSKSDVQKALKLVAKEIGACSNCNHML
jgi:hypothetical protein